MLNDYFVEDFVHLLWEDPMTCNYEDDSEWLCLLYCESFGNKPFLETYEFYKDRVELPDGFYKCSYPDHNEPMSTEYKILAVARIDKILTFTCDPNKATKCTKEACCINDGPCFRTTNSINWVEEKEKS